MDELYTKYRSKGVEFYTVYVRDPHAGQKTKRYDFSGWKQTKTIEERIANAEILINKYGLKRPIIIDDFDEKNIQNTLGGGASNSLLVIDRDGKALFWQPWSDPIGLEMILEEITSVQ